MPEKRMSWIRQHAHQILSGLWRRSHTTPPPLLREGGNLRDAIVEWVKGNNVAPEWRSYRFDPVESDHIFPFIHNSFLSLWRSTEGVLLLPGRDVWPWYVMARRFGLPCYAVGLDEKPPEAKKFVLFDPRISRHVARDKFLMLKIATERSYTKGCTPAQLSQRGKLLFDSMRIFDTGFMGTIPKAIHQDAPRVSTMFSCNYGCNIPQLYPNHKANRMMALAIENWPKYWTSGENCGGIALQTENHPNEVIGALALTVWLIQRRTTFIRTQRVPGSKPTVWRRVTKTPYKG